MTPIFMRIWLMKITMRVRSGDRGRELAQRLAHQPGLHARLQVAHLALELGARGVSAATRIDDQHVDRAGTHQRVGDFERLLAGVRLRNQQVVDY